MLRLSGSTYKRRLCAGGYYFELCVQCTRNGTCVLLYLEWVTSLFTFVKFDPIVALESLLVFKTQFLNRPQL